MLSNSKSFFFFLLSANALELCWWLKGAFLALQSGKSAAIYACAQEQGFEVLEVLLKLHVLTVLALMVPLIGFKYPSMHITTNRKVKMLGSMVKN